MFLSVNCQAILYLGLYHFRIKLLTKQATRTPRLAGGGQARPEAGGSRSHLEKCLDFQLDPRFKFPFGPKFQARLLQEKKIDVSRLAGFTLVPRKLPSVKPRTPC